MRRPKVETGTDCPRQAVPFGQAADWQRSHEAIDTRMGGDWPKGCAPCR
jgi:hypothetical protein